MAIQTNFELFAGDDQTISITVVDENGDVIDITDVDEITWSLKNSQSDDTAIFEKTLSLAEISLTDPDDGLYDVTIGAADTELLSGIYYYESIVTDVSASSYTTSYGHIYFHARGVGITSYCTLEEVKSILANVPITDRTIPKSADAALMVGIISSEIKGVLMGVGYELPITDDQALEYLKAVNIWGACAAILKSKYPSGSSGVGGDAGSAAFWENKYQAALVKLSDPEFNLLSTSDEQPATVGIYAGYYESEEIDLTEYNEPFFRRDMSF
jgi:hypothetical protein